MKKRCLFLLALSVWVFDGARVMAQNPATGGNMEDPADLSAARALIAEAIVMCDSGAWEGAETRAERAYNFLHRMPDQNQGDLAEAAFQTGRAAFNLEKYGGSRPFFLEAAKIWGGLFPEGSLRTADALHYACLCFRYRGKSDDALKTCTEAYLIRKKLLPANHRDLAESLRVMANIYLDLGQYQRAIQQYESALEIEKICSGAESTRVASVLCNLGVAHLRQGNYEKSIAIGEQALIIRQKMLPPDHPDFADSYYGLAFTYKALRKFDEALGYLEKALDIRRKNQGENSIGVAAVYSEIGQIYRAQRNYAKALECFEKGNDIMVALKATNERDYAYVTNDLAQINYSLKNYPKSVEWHEKTVAIIRQSYKNVNSPLASALLNMGVSRLANDDFETALANFLESKQIWTTIFGADDPILSRADGGIAFTYRKWYLATGRDSLLDLSRHYFRLAEKGIEKMVQKEISPDAQRKFLVEAVPVFERAINAEMLFMKRNDQPDAVEKAWELSESMHSYLLYSATQEDNARHFAGIPDAQLTKDSLMRAETTALEKKKQSLMVQGYRMTDSLVLALNGQILAKKEESRKLRNFFETQFPDYYRLKFDLQTVSVAQTQQMLSPQQTLLEYFTGDSSIYVFVLHRGDRRVVEIPRDFPLSEWVQKFQEGMSGYYASKVKTAELYEKTVRQYAEFAQKLYQKLLSPVASYLTPELIIIPGEMLSNLPFEALLTAAPKDLSNFKTYPFVLRSYAVHYAYSATMLHQMASRQHRQPATKGLLALAPFFEEDTIQLAQRLAQDDAMRLGLSPLPFSGEEVIRVKKRFGGNASVVAGKDATKQQFLDRASGYQVLHLATHGKANHKAGEFSYLAFATAGESPETGLLSVGELYNCSLNADLVVLSACETGIGEEQRGEGVVSLARAFAFSGAKSIVSSLWSVNDKSTMQVMDDFYAELNSGKAKNLALTNAKRHYLEEHPGQMAHPFFWAGFVAVGDMSTLKN